MTPNETPTPAADLAALYPLMVEAGCWPDELHINNNIWMYTSKLKLDDDVHPMFHAIDHKNALAIARAAAEDWLRGRGWWVASEWGYYYHKDLDHLGELSLPAAITAELGRK